MRKRYAVKKVIWLFIIGVALLGYVFIEPYWLKVDHQTFVFQDLPKSADSLKVVFVSDIHHGPYFSIERVENLVARINEMKPDLVLLGGDYVHRDPKYIIPCFQVLGKLKAVYGVYGVMGNHDHLESALITQQAAADAGIQLLDHKALWLTIGENRIKIGGVGDLTTDLQNMSAFQDAGENDFTILLSHNPDYIRSLPAGKVDLMLSGHTHGGQVTLFGFWAPFIPSAYGNKYRTGIVKENGTTLLITNGVGTITPPARFFARPQIEEIILLTDAKDSLVSD
jgi:predicted MPP superfamily phosphohydrolase